MSRFNINCPSGKINKNARSRKSATKKASENPVFFGSFCQYKRLEIKFMITNIRLEKEPVPTNTAALNIQRRPSHT